MSLDPFHLFCVIYIELFKTLGFISLMEKHTIIHNLVIPKLDLIKQGGTIEEINEGTCVRRFY